MRAGLFCTDTTPGFGALAAGLEALSFEVMVQVPGCWLESQALRGLDAVVVNGLRARCGDAVRFYGAAGVPVALYEVPHLRMAKEQRRLTPPDGSWLPRFTGSGLAPLDRLEALHVELQTRKRVKSQSILLLGQVGGDAAHGMDGSAFRRWAESTLDTLHKLTESKVVWRPHPEDVWKLDGADSMSHPSEESLADAFDRSWLVVTYNSTAGLEALIAGLPVIAEGRAVYSSLAWHLNQFARVAPADQGELRDLLAAIAYTQWTDEEIASGAPLRAALYGEPFDGRVVDAPAAANAPAEVSASAVLS